MAKHSQSEYLSGTLQFGRGVHFVEHLNPCPCMIDSRLKMELGNVRKGFEDFTRYCLWTM